VAYLLQFWRFLQAAFLKFDRVPSRVSPSLRHILDMLM
jgi:hypothetical protein